MNMMSPKLKNPQRYKKELGPRSIRSQNFGFQNIHRFQGVWGHRHTGFVVIVLMFTYYNLSFPADYKFSKDRGHGYIIVSTVSKGLYLIQCRNSLIVKIFFWRNVLSTRIIMWSQVVVTFPQSEYSITGLVDT